MTDGVPVTAGVGLFFHDPADGRAVRSLWKTGLDDAPPHLAFADLPLYARSWLVAQSVKVELFCFLQAVWEEVWIRPGSVALSHDDARATSDTAEAELIEWIVDGDEEGLDRCFFGVVRLAKGMTIECAVGLTDEGGFGMWARSSSPLRTTPQGWGDEDDRFLYARDVAEIENGSLPLSAARRLADAFLLEASHA